MYLRLIPTASYSRLLPCDIAYMAFRVDMGKFRWGFNRFGQLGLGLCVSGQNSKSVISTYTISPRRVVHFPGSVAFANAAANSSAAVRAEDGMLFTWGSGEARRLGHFLEKGLNTEHVHCPRSVPGLREHMFQVPL